MAVEMLNSGESSYRGGESVAEFARIQSDTRRVPVDKPKLFFALPQQGRQPVRSRSRIAA